MSGDFTRYEQAKQRLAFVAFMLTHGRGSAVVPRVMLSDGDRQRRALPDAPHAVVNVPVEYARARWGWGQRKTKTILGVAIALPFVLYFIIGG